MPRYFGLDLHKEYVHGCEWFPDLGKGRLFRFPNTLEAWQGFIASEVDETSKVALEVTGNAFQVYDLLSEAAGQVVMANPIEMKRLGSGRHTDSVDAERLAKMLILGTLPAVWVPPQGVREMRALVSHREQLVRQRTRCQNVAKGVLRRNGYCVSKDQDIRAWLAAKRKELRLGGADLAIVTSTVRMLGYINEEITAIEGEIGWRAAANREIRLLMSNTGGRASATLRASVGPRQYLAILALSHRFTSLARKTAAATSARMALLTCAAFSYRQPIRRRCTILGRWGSFSGGRRSNWAASGR